MQATTALRGAFLIQTTAVFTPLLATAAGDAPSGAVWAGCLLGLAGAVLVASEGSGGGSSGAAAEAGTGMLGAAAPGRPQTLGKAAALSRPPRPAQPRPALALP